MTAAQRIMSPAFVLACAIALACAVACGRPTGVPESSSGSTQKLPFDREPRSTGVSPSKSAIPATSRLPEGTSLAVRLRKRISSASARPGDSFEGTLDDPAIVEGQTLIARGAMVSGRVLDAKPSSSAHASGYLRITLITINVQGETYLIDTSSIFAKGGSHDERPSATGTASSGQSDAVIPADHRLTFRLAQAVDLQ